MRRLSEHNPQTRGQWFSFRCQPFG